MDPTTITLISSTVFLFVTTLTSELLGYYNPQAGSIFQMILKAFQDTPIVPISPPAVTPVTSTISTPQADTSSGLQYQATPTIPITVLLQSEKYKGDAHLLKTSS